MQVTFDTEDVSAVYREYMNRLISEKQTCHKVVCKEAGISYSHSRAILKEKANASESSLYKLIAKFYSRQEALSVLKNRLGYDYEGGEITEKKDARSADLPLSGHKQVYFFCKLIALEHFPLDEIRPVLGGESDALIAAFEEMALCKVVDGTVIATADWLETLSSPTVREMARMIASLTNPDLEFNVENACASGLNRLGLLAAKRAMFKFWEEMLKIFADPQFKGNEVFAFSLNSTVL